MGAVTEATEVRDKEYKEYAGERTESEQCTGALEAAINVLNGAGTKTGFLQSKEAELYSVVAGVRSALGQKNVPQMREQDMELLRHFVQQPGDFVHGRSMSAAQVGNNPFGDYAPQSTQIQGILKGMYDAFTSDLEKSNAEEADSQKSFEELMATKKKEMDTLASTLAKQETDKADKEKTLAESETLLDDTTTTLAADEAFFADTKDACEVKAKEWSVRTRLRTEELAGIQQAIKILTSKEALKTFKESSETFLQVASVHTSRAAEARSHAYNRLRTMAAQMKSRSLAKIAVEVNAGGHFDKVIAMIDEMMGVLRKEEQDDISQKDRCENDMNGNSNELEDLTNEIAKTKQAIKRMSNTRSDIMSEIKKVKDDIADTKKSMADLLKMRNQESEDFVKALKEDTDAKALIEAAIGALAKFYKNNKISLVQKRGPSYTEDPDKAPETSWSGSDYGGRQSENTGIVAILEMLAEDLAKEIADGRADDAAAQEKYLKQNGALTDTLEAQEATKVSLEQEKADLEGKMDDAGEHLSAKSADKKGESKTAGALADACDWIKQEFGNRRAARKAEMDGLVEAKSFLSGSI